MTEVVAKTRTLVSGGLPRVPAWGGLAGSLLVICVLLTFLSPYFLTVDNGLNIARAVSWWGVAALLTTVVLVGGALDLSIGAVIGFSGVLCALLIETGFPWPIAAVLGVASGAVFGAINGWMVAYIGVNPFVVTIAAAFAIRGLAYLLAGGRDILITSDAFNEIGQGEFLGIPILFYFLVGAFVVTVWILRATVFGRHVFAIGGSAEASRLVGVPVKRRRFQLLVLSGTAAGLSGILLASYSGSGLAYNGAGIELTVIAAVILGGTSLLGGKGTAIGTLLGIALLGVITNGITLLGIGAYWQLITLGVVLALAVVLDELRVKRSRR